ncbi:unnamed protein product [Adineta steineri]|uniref:Uncharacterized protein n=1 Tax=Adineta steineri TaxID=433720 RepID=A0A819UN47_9BILA|nr:unnamed protein product [Adineta steineri]CAF4095141.1 unnamed protein product [Adineta steineri]
MCHSCDVTDLTQLIIPAKPITNEQLSTYHETLSYVATDYENQLNSDRNRICYETLNNEQCESFSGLTKRQIQQLAVDYNLTEQKIFLFYTKCNTSNSDRLLGTIFGMSYSLISRIFNQCIEDLYNNLVSDDKIYIWVWVWFVALDLSLGLDSGFGFGFGFGLRIRLWIWIWSLDLDLGFGFGFWIWIWIWIWIWSLDLDLEFGFSFWIWIWIWIWSLDLDLDLNLVPGFGFGFGFGF